MKILILKPSSLGDVVQALPVLRLLKRHLPASEVYWWIDTNLAPLLEGDPDLKGVVHFHRRRWAAPRYWPEIVQSIGWMRRQGFDWILDLQGLMRSGLFAWLANGKLTVGLDEPREGARGLYDIIVRRPSPQTHAVDWYLEVLRPLEIPVTKDFSWLPDRPAVAEAIQSKWPVSQGRWIVLQPGARWVTKRWPVEQFAALVEQVAARRPDLRYVILGGNEDRVLGEKLNQLTGQSCLDLTGQISLVEMVEWIRASELMVTNDTGPMHVAAALSKPVVGLFGPTDPRRTGPYGQVDRVLQLDLPCVPCLNGRCFYSNSKHLQCLRGLTAAVVAEAVLERLKAEG